MELIAIQYSQLIQWAFYKTGWMRMRKSHQKNKWNNSSWYSNSAGPHLMSSIFVSIFSHPLDFIFHIFSEEMQYAYNTLILKLKIVLHFQLYNLLAILYPCWVAALCWHLSVFSVADGIN